MKYMNHTLLFSGLVGIAVGSYHLYDILKPMQTYELGWNHPAVAAEAFKTLAIVIGSSMVAAVANPQKVIKGVAIKFGIPADWFEEGA